MDGRDPRAAAIERLTQRRNFHHTAVVFAGVSVLLIVIWAVTSGFGFFWPVFPILGMGLALVAQGYKVYGHRPISEDDIQREMQRDAAHDPWRS